MTDGAVLTLPRSDSVVEVHIIDTTTQIVVPAKVFIQPVLKGHETLNFPDFAFLVQNKQLGKTILFDSGCRKDWWKLSPAVLEGITADCPALRVEKSINEILTEGGFDPNRVDGIVWSHWHWDHLGNPALFPESTEIIVGPGFKRAFMPGYPAKSDSPVLETDFEGRDVREIQFDSKTKIGHFSAFDFFGDGSFYILDVPGHAVGHICGLARTMPDTFVFMGGDACHFAGCLRPSATVPLPATVPSETFLDQHFPRPCPCSIFTACHPHPTYAHTMPFYEITQSKAGWYVDPPVAQQSVNALAEFDADDNVFVCVAHDGSLREVCEFFPQANMNDWKAKGWKVRSQWGFLNELPIDGEPGRPWVIPAGLIK